MAAKATKKKTVKKTARKTTTRKTSQPVTPEPEAFKLKGAWLKIGWVALAIGWIFVALSLVSFSPMDPPSHSFYAPQIAPNAVHNLCGVVGARIAYEFYLMLGVPATWFIMTAGLAYLIITLFNGALKQLFFRVLGVLFMAYALSAAMYLLSPYLSDFPEGSGGLLAIYTVHHLTLKFNTIGTSMILLLIFAVGLVLAADHLVMRVPALLQAGANKAGEAGKPKLEEAGASLRQGTAGVLSKAANALVEPKIEPDQSVADESEVNASAVAIADMDEEEAEAQASKPAKPKRRGGRKKKELEKEIEASASSTPSLSAPSLDESDQVIEDTDSEEAEKSKPIDTKALREKFKNLPVSMARPAEKKATELPREQDLTGYQFPGIDLLEEPEHNSSDEVEKSVRQQAENLQKALKNYRIEAEVVAIDSGPTITMYEIQMAPGAKVSQLNSVSSDLARSLRAQNIRIVPNMAGKTTVGIEVPNLEKETVRLKDLMLQSGDALKKMALPMYLGKDASGSPLVLDLAKMPHVLIAGTTGSGKSVTMNTIITSFLFARRPDELKLVLVDPKMVEMSQYKDIPHLMCPVVTEMNKAAAILEWAVTKMDERYELLAEVGKRHIDDYNAMEWEEIKEIMQPGTEQEEARIPKKMPRMVFIIDELADLMMTNKEVESHIVRIAQKARAVGIHLILATQRPQANVVTGLIKSNMPCRISCKVASSMDSRIVLDTKGAELLLGQGDMMVLNPRKDGIMRAQGTFLDDFEIRRVVKFLKKVAKPSFEPQLTQLKAPGGAGGSGGDAPADRDERFEEALRVVLESQRGSVSLLQRRMTIGYGRASRIIEQIAEAGFLGEHKGSQAREVLMTLEEYEALQKDAAAIQASNDEEAKNLGSTSWD